jgi:hypothetical protein
MCSCGLDTLEDMPQDEPESKLGISAARQKVKLRNKPQWHFARPTRWGSPGLPLH